ncbi:dermonecrotic toxin domain-containing protein [Pseudomonas sp. DWP1b1]|uniref:dermonecrotic toxin domain-containing protein n=1 Tax=unclassified Pseudomonas TaxID=196821 RepID=UPI003CEC4587
MTLTPSTYSHQNLTDTLITQMSTGPAFREVAATLLREQLQELYPALDIDPNVTMVGTPIWDIEDGHVVPVGRHYKALTDILAVQAVLAVPVLYIEGEHFLTQLPIVEPAVHLPVRILDITRLLNALAPLMLRGYQQAQMEYWNASEADSGPRWHALSKTLRDFWNLDQAPGLTDDDCQLAHQLYRTPDFALRSVDDPQAVRAYVIDIDQVDDKGKTTHLDEHLISVLTGQQKGHEVVLTHTLLDGFKKHTSLEQLGEDLPQLLGTELGPIKVQWRLVEPNGDFFDYLACAFISLQIMAIGSINFSGLREPGASQRSLIQPPAPQATPSGPDLQQYVQALPDWLTAASASDQDAFSRHLKDLATLHSLNRGRTYQEGISPIQQYALDQLNAEMLKDHPTASTGWLGNLEIVVRSPVIWGLFPVPGQFDTSIFSLTELALQNLIALPLGVKTLRQRKQEQLPDWLTLDYLEDLISRVDIGNTYPTLVKETLLDDPLEAARRQLLYTQHLRIQLPMLALQCKIRDEGGINEQGYRYITALMQAAPADRQVEGQMIVIRPLAFVPSLRLDTTPDVVANMFVIGPQDMDAGPCLLYRPLLDKPLSQFPSPNNLLYALQQSANLRDSVLAWLPDANRDDYAQFVFPGDLPSPWAVLKFLVDRPNALAMSGPVKLSQNTVDGDLFATLYNANANALVTLADRKSVSNAEARWATFKRVGWAAFNAVLPFLGRTVGTAAWIWQIMDQLQNVVDAQSHPEQESPWAALADLLLNIGMAITLHSVTHRSPGQAQRGKALPPPPPQPPT